jgi:hypothetical protein
MRQEIDAYPEGTQFLCRLKDVDVHADLMQAEGCSEPTDAGSDDDEP